MHALPIQRVSSESDEESGHGKIDVPYVDNSEYANWNGEDYSDDDDDDTYDEETDDDDDDPLFGFSENGNGNGDNEKGGTLNSIFRQLFTPWSPPLSMSKSTKMTPHRVIDQFGSLQLSVNRLAKSPGPPLHKIEMYEYEATFSSTAPTVWTLAELIDKAMGASPKSLVLTLLQCRLEKDDGAWTTEDGLKITVTGLEGFASIIHELGTAIPINGTGKPHHDNQRGVKTSACIYTSCVSNDEVSEWAHWARRDTQDYLRQSKHSTVETVELDARGWLAHGLYRFAKQQSAIQRDQWILARSADFQLVSLQVPQSDWIQYHRRLTSMLNNMCVVQDPTAVKISIQTPPSRPYSFTLRFFIEFSTLVNHENEFVANPLERKQADWGAFIDFNQANKPQTNTIDLQSIVSTSSQAPPPPLPPSSSSSSSFSVDIHSLKTE